MSCWSIPDKKIHKGSHDEAEDVRYMESCHEGHDHSWREWDIVIPVLSSPRLTQGFEGWSMVLWKTHVDSRYDGRSGITAAQVPLYMVPFWVQVHNLPT